MITSKSKILFQISGSIAAFKACSLISQLVKAGYEVQTVCSPSALEFIGPATLEGLTGKPVLTHSFEKGNMMGHIDWARWADLIVLCPASAQMINALSAGTGNGLIGDIFLANNFLKPYWIVPAMNTQMYQHPATQASISKLKSWGARVLETASGDLACGEYGEGRMLEPEVILNKIKNHFNKNNLKVLVTAGGTTEPIDGVRTISNTSTGETGKTIAEYLYNQGSEVYFIRSSSTPSLSLENEFVFKSSADLQKILKSLLKQKFDYIIHAAAVSDFVIDKINVNGKSLKSSEKLNSSDKIVLNLKKNLKIIDQLKKYSSEKNVKVIGFKLTNSQNEKENLSKVLKLSFNPAVDFVVHNDLSKINSKQHVNDLYKKDKIIFKGKTKQDLAKNIFELMRSTHDSLS